MPPKKSDECFLLATTTSSGAVGDVLEVFTSREAAEEAAHDGITVIQLPLHTGSASKKSAAKQPAQKKVATRTKAKKPAKEEEDDDVNDDDENEDAEVEVDEDQVKANAKKARGPAKRKQIPDGQEGSLEGVKLIFTGTFEQDRKTCEATAVKYGAEIVTQLKHADIVVLGTKPGPKKVEEIEKNGYKTTDEEGFNQMIQDGVDAVKTIVKKKKA